tara:strand:- start:1094 stop:1528 length:435 start_codon:yes stop_codon:yes gene_type:complete
MPSRFIPQAQGYSQLDTYPTAPAGSPVSPPAYTGIANTARGLVSGFNQTGKSMRFVIANIVIILVFGTIYTIWMWAKPEDWANPLGENEEFGIVDKIFNGLYTSVVTHTSVGFGDIFPKSEWAKVTLMLHVIITFMMNLYIGLS